MNFYKLGIELALAEVGLTKQAMGRTRQYMHEQVYKQMAPGAPLPQDMRGYVQNQQQGLFDRRAWNKNLGQQQASMQQQVAAKGQPMAMPDTRAQRGQLQQAIGQQKATGGAVAAGEIAPRKAGKAMAKAEQATSSARGAVQQSIAHRPPMATAPIPGGAPGAAGAKGGFLRGLGRFAGKHPLMTGLAAAGAVGAGAYAATRPKPVTQDYWGG